MYKVQVYVEHGIFEYDVKEMSSALEHGQAIAKSGVYRRANTSGAVEFYRVMKVKVVGEGLESAYTDTFRRT